MKNDIMVSIKIFQKTILKTKVGMKMAPDLNQDHVFAIDDKIILVL
jgi:hypothetical protein